MVSETGAGGTTEVAPGTGTPASGANTSASRNRDNRRSQGGGRGRSSSRGRDRLQRPPSKKFVGKEESLGDEFVYQHTTGREASDQYTSTTDEIIRYTCTKYKNGDDVGSSLADETKMVIALPTAPDAVGVPPTIPVTEMMVWKMEVNLVLQRKASLDSSLKSAYSLIKGQCSKPILEKVEAQANYATVHLEKDPIGLLKLIKGVMFNYNSRKFQSVAIFEVSKLILSVSQTRYMSASEYLEKFRTQLDVLKSAGGEISHHPGMVAAELEKAGVTVGLATDQEKSDASTKAREKYEATVFLLNSDQTKYGRLIQELANDFNKGRDEYPTTLTGAYELMLHDDRHQDTQHQPPGNSGLAFTNIHDGTRIAGTNAQPNPRPDVTCHKCGRVGHFSNKCAEARHIDGTTLCIVLLDASDGQDAGSDVEDVALAIIGDTHEVDDSDDPQAVGFSFFNDGCEYCVSMDEHGDRSGDVAYEAVDDGVDGLNFLNDEAVAKSSTHWSLGPVPKSWILLDNQSTVDVFCSAHLLQNIRESPTSCRISCNAGVVEVRMIGDLPGYPVPVWFNPNGIANILSLYRVTQHCRVQYDSRDNQAAFHVTRSDSSIRHFVPSVTGLHYCETVQNESVLINTVAAKKSNYTIRAYKQAVVARHIQDTIGRPSTRDFVKIVEGGMLRNCPISRADIVAAEDIFGPNLGSLKGKTVRRKGQHVPSLVADVPYHIIKTHRDITLCFDIMFVNKIAFLVTVSRKIRFGTTERILSRHSDVVGQAIIRVLIFYCQRGFRVKECNGDNEFGVLRAALADEQAHLNVTAEDEHVPEVERYIRTIKERTRAVYNTVPFSKIPAMMIVEMLHASNYWLNMFPANDGVSSVQSPRRIMTGQHGDYNLHCQLQFGEYVQVHESHDNSMLSRTTGAIALRPTGNIQGGYYFMSLTTGKRLSRKAWTPLPMPGEVIDRVLALARGNPAGGDLQFGWRDGSPIEDLPDDEDDLHDEDYFPQDNDSDSDDDGSYAPEPHPAGGVGYNDADDDDSIPDLLERQG
jgi:hypothetical protein